jgi:nucleotide-binding universal stress UspA family protein
MESNEQPVVVGFDGSKEAGEALGFGAELARMHGWPLRVVIARGDLHRLSAWADEWTQGLAEEWAADAVKMLAEDEMEAVVVVADGLAAQVLVAESRQAAAVLVGATGHGFVTGRLQGSVSQHVCRHAASPVVVVRPGGRNDGVVVVGVDGSGSSLRALELALHEAGLRGLQLEVLYAPEHVRAYGFPAPVVLPAELVRSLRAHDESVLDAVAAVVADHPGVDVAVRTVEGAPARALVRASEDAALVVVGSRGVGAFEGVLLGSVSAGVLRGAHCPVAVVR